MQERDIANAEYYAGVYRPFLSPAAKRAMDEAGVLGDASDAEGYSAAATGGQSSRYAPLK